MNPSDSAGFELPSISSEDAADNTTGVNNNAQAYLDASTVNPQVGLPATPTSAATITDASQGANNSASSTTNGSNALQFAQDKDLIDKEWVNKAKEIVMKNLDDPYKQSEELTLLKADYMKKRFNKTLKLSK
jgi:hypothetical protein